MKAALAFVVSALPMVLLMLPGFLVVTMVTDLVADAGVSDAIALPIASMITVCAFVVMALRWCAGRLVGGTVLSACDPSAMTQ